MVTGKGEFAPRNVGALEHDLNRYFSGVIPVFDEILTHVFAALAEVRLPILAWYDEDEMDEVRGKLLIPNYTRDFTCEPIQRHCSANTAGTRIAISGCTQPLIVKRKLRNKSEAQLGFVEVVATDIIASNNRNVKLSLHGISRWR